jgi:8-oxo-dGTP diphosphatase
MMNVFGNQYDGIIIDDSTFPQTSEEFLSDLSKLIESYSSKQLIWINIPLEKSDFIPLLVNLGFEFHHCNDRKLMLVKKLATGAVIPTTKNYIAGVGAIVIKNNRLLVIKDRFSIGYRIPGGQIDKDESIKEALAREVFEETGIEIEFEAIVSIGHFRKGQFGESNLYLVCTAIPLTENIMIHDKSEVIEALWINIDDFLNSDETNNYNKSLISELINNRGIKLKEQKIKLRVKDGEVFF